jgi:hypothetical protein
MHCANCGQWIEIPPHDELRFVRRQADSSYLVLAELLANTRLVHQCGLRG